MIDKEVQELVITAYERTKNLLTEHKEQLEKLAQLLLEKEVVEIEDLERILGKREIEELVENTE